MAIRDDVRDAAVAAAKSHEHLEVEPRHVLWGLLVTLGDSAPPDVVKAQARSLLEPRGTAMLPPSISPAAEQELSTFSSIQEASARCSDLSRRLLEQQVVGPPATTQSAPVSDAVPQTESVFSATPRPVERESVANVLADLDALVGLDAVRAAIRRLVAVQRLNSERRSQGLPEIGAGSHLVFTGPPGTGKTTVARLVGRLYGALGVVSRGHVIEASRADLVAGYVGQTALKVQSMVERALGGVLFVDEAYALTHGDRSDFGEEAIATLVKMMEDHRSDLAVIVAGYSREMSEFIDSNPGLRSRFTHYIEFPNYTVDQLIEIFVATASKAQVQLAEDVPDRLRTVFENALKNDNFGNARFVRSTFERAYSNMAQRALEDDVIAEDELRNMTSDDLPDLERPGRLDRRKIGFGSEGT